MLGIALLYLGILSTPLNFDPELTPGVPDPLATKEIICKPGYTSKVRHVTDKMKADVLHAYRAHHPDWPLCQPDGKVLCEYDHLISLELGGSNDTKNLWPEPYTGDLNAHEKDKVENFLHREVCKGTITLQDAQKKILDWVDVLKTIPVK
jgi:hypothetical protein